MAAGGYNPNEWHGKSRMTRLGSFSVRALGISARNCLSSHLDVANKCFSRTTGIQKDWQGLADLMGFGYQEIQLMDQKGSGMTMELLERWSHTSGASIGQLLDFLEQMERFDILENPIFQNLVESSVDSFQRRQKKQEQDYNLVERPVQVPVVDTSDHPTTRSYSALQQEEYSRLTLNDAPGRPEFFDAYVCYTHDDMDFVKQVIMMLENVHGLKLCIPDRDILPGCAKYPAISHLVKNRCQKIMIVVSEKYLISDECDFMTKFGHSLAPGARNKKLIPVLIQRDCEIPDILRFITLIDFTKCDLVEWFWHRLAKALQDNNEGTEMISLVENPDEEPQEATLVPRNNSNSSSQEQQQMLKRAGEELMSSTESMDSSEGCPYNRSISTAPVSRNPVAGPSGHRHTAPVYQNPDHSKSSSKKHEQPKFYTTNHDRKNKKDNRRSKNQKTAPRPIEPDPPMVDRGTFF